MSRNDTSSARRILEAARIAFATKGFHGASTRDIASTAGFSPGSVYVYHKSKEAILFDLAHEGHRNILTGVRGAAEANSQSPRRELRAVVHQLTLLLAQDPVTARLVNYEIGSLTPEHRQVLASYQRQIQQLMSDPLKRGIAAGDFKVEHAGMTVAAITGMCVDTARWYRSGTRWTPERLADHFAGLAMRMVAATGD